MARYFFHVVDGQFIPDTQGVECATTDEVKSEAVRSAGELLEEQGLGLWETGRWDMFICDEQNNTLLKLSFEARDLTGGMSGGLSH